MKTLLSRCFLTRGPVLAVALFAWSVVQAQVTPSPPLYQDKTSSPERRANDLLPRLTLDEKIGLLSGDRDGFSTKAIDRLGVPKLMMSDGPQGVRNYGPACSLPSGAALAATFDVDLARRYGTTIGLEARARSVNIMLGPAMNICRVAVCGRNFEYYGEDPFLAGEIASNYVRGVQEQDVIATIKHFACNNEEWDRDSVDVMVDDRALHEIYLPAFRRCVQEGDTRAVMCAYNRVNGFWCSDNDVLLNQILKGEWNFKGFVMSDWGATHNVSDLPHGLDLEMPRGEIFTPDAARAALASGQWKTAEIDNAVRRFLVAAFAMHFFDRPQKRPDLPIESPDSSKLALDVARSAIVLLKNEKDALPLDHTKVRTIAVYGRFATQTPTHGEGSGGVEGFHPVNYLDGIRAAAGPGVKVTYVEAPAPDPSLFQTMACAYLPDGKTPGLQLTASLSNNNEKIPPTVTTQSGVNFSWDDAHRPSGIPRGEQGQLEWKGVLLAPEDGNWELVQHGENIKIGTPPPQYHDGHPEQWQPGDGLRLKKGEAVPISIAVGIDSGGSGNIQVGLRPFPKADLTAARQADAVIVCVGRVSGEGSDSFFEEPLVDEELIKAVAAVNHRTIVVNTSGAGLDMADWVDQVPALLHMSFLGQAAGTALGEILFGDVNPSGRLPMTFDRYLSDNLAIAHYPIDEVEQPSGLPRIHYAEGLFVGYRGYDKTGKTPLFPFGHGLSYTHFTYTNLRVEKKGDGARATLNVTNDGKRAGAEVVQLYVGQPGASVERPLRELKGVGKVTLQPGETHRIEIDLPRDSFAYWDLTRKAWTVEPGRFTIQAAASERDIRLTKELELK